eukprot:TRINITY_DN1271_c0_g1_i3.p1 TRINITY_DN1271_c0_g1~~TRINITY_DN1271_c0_g1_i3.p1  ORF type:complete len:442 (+),score=95.12 TRINITY_DN1271_c0_g1_i3:118-1443(+)
MSLVTALIEGIEPEVMVDEWSVFNITPSEPITEDQIEIEIFGPSQPLADMVSNLDGSFDVKWSVSEPGEYEIEILVDGVLVPGAPFPVTVYPSGAPALSMTSRETIFGPGLWGEPISLGRNSFTLIPRDPLTGNVLKYNFKDIFAAIDGPSFAVGTVSQNSDGTYKVVWDHNVPGTYTVNISVGKENAILYDTIAIQSGHSGANGVPSAKSPSQSTDNDVQLTSLISNLAAMQNRLETLQTGGAKGPDGNASPKNVKPPSIDSKNIKPVEPAKSLRTLESPRETPKSLRTVESPRDVRKTPPSTSTSGGGAPLVKQNSQPLNQGAIATANIEKSSSMTPQARIEKAEKPPEKVVVKVYFSDGTFKTFAVTSSDTALTLVNQIANKSKIKDKEKYSLFSKQNKNIEELAPDSKIYSIQINQGWSGDHQFLFTKKKKKSKWWK